MTGNGDGLNTSDRLFHHAWQDARMIARPYESTPYNAQVAFTMSRKGLADKISVS
jgi:hypothetical protein